MGHGPSTRRAVMGKFLKRVLGRKKGMEALQAVLILVMLDDE